MEAVSEFKRDLAAALTRQAELEGYVCHLNECEKWRGEVFYAFGSNVPQHSVCTCGLEALLARSAAEAE